MISHPVKFTEDKGMSIVELARPQHAGVPFERVVGHWWFVGKVRRRKWKGGRDPGLVEWNFVTMNRVKWMVTLANVSLLPWIIWGLVWIQCLRIFVF